MTIVLSLASKLLPLYLNILLGYIAGRRLGINSETIARLMFFLINPLIIFNGIATTKMDASILSLPLVIFCISCFMCVIFYRLSRRIWQDPSKNLVAFSAGSGNTGYFGLSLALMVLNDQSEGIYIMAILGVTLFENTLGYYITAKGSHTPKECLKKLLVLPAIYAMLLGLTVNFLSIPLTGVYSDFIVHVKGAYTLLGMMIVGLGIASMKKFKIDFKFLSLTFAAKFLIWPLMIFSIIGLDMEFFHFYNHDIYQVLIMLSIVPMAVNTIVMASLMNYQSDKTASAVLLSTVFAIFYVPLMASLFID